MNKAVACGLLLLLVGQQGCCFRTKGIGADEGVAAISDATPIDAIEIVGWGPRETRAGVAFNPQGSGRAAIWIRVDRSLDGRRAWIQFDDAFLEGQVSGETVTAVVPEASYAKPGEHEVRVIARSADAHWRSGKVRFKVEQGPPGLRKQ